MNTRHAPYAARAAYLSGIFAILSAVFLILFFWLEAPADSASAGQGSHIWGLLSDICPIVQMLALLAVAHVLYRLERSSTPGLSLMAYLIGIAGMLGVALLQLLLILGVIPFEQEVTPVLIATAAVGVWLILVNSVGARQRRLSARMAWLGMAVGAAFVLEPVIFSILGGAMSWRNIMSNPLLLMGSALVFVLAYAGFPIWAFWLGRAFAGNRRKSTWQPHAAAAPGMNN